MKILYCIPHLHKAGGMQRILTEKANYFADFKGYEVTIVTTDQMGHPNHFKLSSKVNLIHLDIDFDGHFDSAILIKVIQHVKKIRKYKNELTKIIDELRIDICISLCGKEVNFLYQIKGRFKKIAELHFSSNFKQQFIQANHKGVIWNLIGNYLNREFKRAILRLDKVVVLTAQDFKSLSKRSENVIKINNFNTLNPSQSGELINKKVISIGKLNSQKGFDLLIDSWVIVSKIHSDWILEIYGDGEWELFLKKKICEKGLTKQILLKGVISNVENAYCDSSIYIMSSRFEGFPMVLLEALSCGLPVVSFNCESGPSEILEDGISGLLVEPENIEELAMKIIFLIENPIVRYEMGINAYHRAKYFSKNTILSQWEKLFIEILEN
jgi:glycosyltransferase involved in cell wall biosynthesis